MRRANNEAANFASINPDVRATDRTDAALRKALKTPWTGLPRPYGAEFSVFTRTRDRRTAAPAESAWSPGNRTFVLPATSVVLSDGGWVSAGALAVGSQLAQSTGGMTTVDGFTIAGAELLYRVTLADGTGIDCASSATLPVHIGGWENAAEQLYVEHIAELLAGSQPIRISRLQPVNAMWSLDERPLDGYLVGVLLGDGYLRDHCVELCNEQEELHGLVQAALPAGARLGPPRVGRRGTAVSILGTNGCNPVLEGLRVLGLAGTHAWDKFIPDAYLGAPLEQRLALLQGLFDTDGSIDQYGRIEFSTASPALADGVLAILQSLGGRATMGIRKNIMFTSPNQPTPKQARDAYRFTGVRLPDFSIFRLGRKARRDKRVRRLGQWTIKLITPVGFAPTARVTVSDLNTEVISGAFVAVAPSPGPADRLGAASTPSERPAAPSHDAAAA